MIYGTQDFAQLLKEIIKDGRRHDLYDLTRQHAKEMSVHIEGEKPLYLLERVRPREDEDVKTYRIENYEPTTKAGADKAIKIVCKGFNPSLWSINFKDKSTEAEELERYTMENYPVYNSIIDWNKDVLLRKMLADPNGLVAVKPERIPGSDTEPVDPIMVVYGSCAVWYYDKDCFLICTSHGTMEHGDHMYQNENDKKLSCTFDYYDRTQYVNFTATYDASDKSIEIDEHEAYTHAGSKIPVWFLGGESKGLDNGRVMYRSYFSAALPHWNLAVVHESDLLGAYIGHLHPQKYEMAEECAYSEMIDGVSCGCRQGVIRFKGPENKLMQKDCPQCQGSGLVTVKSPYQTYLFSKSKLEDTNGLGIMPAGYITVPTEATAMLEERTEKMIQKGMWSINMDIEEKIGENQSGVAKTIDRSAQNDTLYDIHSRVFGVHINNEYYFIDMYKNRVKLSSTGKSSKNLPEVNAPVKFDLLTTSELTYNYKVSKDSGLDRNILRLNAINIIKSENGSTPDVKNYLIAMIDLDPLYGMDSEEIDLGVTKGVIRKVDWTIHNNIKPFVDRAMIEDKNFLAKPKDQQIELLETYGNELIKSEQPRVDAAMIIPDFDNEDNDRQNAA